MINFGLELKKKEVFLRGKSAKKQEYLGRRSLMGRREDDKNKSLFNKWWKIPLLLFLKGKFIVIPMF